MNTMFRACRAKDIDICKLLCPALKHEPGTSHKGFGKPKKASAMPFTTLGGARTTGTKACFTPRFCGRMS